MSFRKKLVVGFGSLLGLMITLFVILSLGLSTIKTNMYNIVEDRYKKVTIAQTIKDNFSTSIYDLNNVAREPDPAKLPERAKAVEAKQQLIWADINKAKAMVNTDRGRELISEIENQYRNYAQTESQIVSNVLTGKKNDPATAELSKQILERVSTVNAKLDEYKSFQELRMNESLLASIQTYNMSMALILLTIFLSLIIGGLIARWVINSLVGSLNTISSTVSAVEPQMSDLPRLPVSSMDEVGAIAVAFNKMADSLESYNKKERSYVRTIEEQNWLKSSSAELSDIYQGITDINRLAGTFINKVTPMLNAAYGVFYLLEGKGVDQKLVKAASFAASGQGHGTETFYMGEGLVGQCALEKRIMRINQVPEGYFPIKSGLGQMQPNHILIAPILFAGEVVGVLEVASITEFNQVHEDLLNEVLGSLGINVNRIKDRMEIERLLKEAQSMTKELQAQSEELQTQNEEMQMQSEELRMINERLQDRNQFAEDKARELQQTKNELENKAEQLMLSSRYKSEFLANMSHELRTPLNSMLILSEMLANNSDGNLSDEQQEFARVIHSAGQDLLNLINDILDLSKVEAGKMEIIFEETNLSELLWRLETNFTHFAKQKRLQFTVTREADVPELILTDEQRLQQILKNLLSNAMKFTEEGSVSMHVRKLDPASLPELKLAPTDDYVLEIAVSDTGVGVPADKHELIFDAFQQANGSTSRKFGGTGLGLAISREFAKMLGGWITLESEEGKGSTFTLYIPSAPNMSKQEVFAGLMETAASTTVVSEADAVEQWTEEGESPFKHKRILVVDDDKRNVYALSNALENQGMQVITAKDGREGLDALMRESQVDLVLMDIMMPEMDGYEAIRAIREMPAFENLPVIALTAKAMKSDREKCLEAGASDYISKPLELDQLMSVMRVWLTK